MNTLHFIIRFMQLCIFKIELNNAIQSTLFSFYSSPDTQDYIRMVEEQSRSKTEQGKTENKSFFAKYVCCLICYTFPVH